MKSTMATAAAVLLLASCSTGDVLDDMNFVQRDWEKSIRRLGAGINPVYPPSEDYQIGDVYAVRDCGKRTNPDGRNLLAAVKIADIPQARELLDQYYRNRVRLPNTANALVNNANGGKLSKEKGQQSDDPGIGRDVFVRSETNGFDDALSITAFPNYTIAAGKAFNFAGSLAGSAFGLIFGAAATKDTEVSLELGANSTFGLPAYAAENLITTFCSRDNKCSEDKLKRALAGQTGSSNEGCYVYVQMVSRLYVTRAIVYKYKVSEAQVARLVTGRLDTLKLFADKADTLAKTPSTPAPTGSEAVAATRDTLLQTLLGSVKEDVAALAANPGANGAALTIGSYGLQGIALTETYSRPLAFAYSAYSVEPRNSPPGGTTTTPNVEPLRPATPPHNNDPSIGTLNVKPKPEKI